MIVSLTFRCEAILGEGATWDVDASSLWWVDILGKRLFCGNPADGTARTWDFETEITASVGLSDRRRALILRDRVELFDPASGLRTTFWQGDEPASNRFNDAGVDRQGNLWIGSMDEAAAEPTGALWRVDGKGHARRILSGFRVVNGPVFSPDGSILYLADTMAGRVLAFNHNAEDGTLSNHRILVDLKSTDGLSDGMAIDTEGCLWLARLCAGRITRYSPDGTPLLTVALPVPIVTSVAFGGPDFKTLFVTTARILLDAVDLEAYPESGCVFSVRVPIEGTSLSKMIIPLE